MQQAIELATKTLTSTAESDHYDMITGLAFGTDYNQSIFNSLQQSFLLGDFSQLPNVQIISSSILGDADAAYATELNTIFLSDEFVNSSDEQAIAGALLEEVEHYIDAQINVIDFAGDEGEVFSKLVQGENLDADQLVILRQENDHGVINFNEQQINVEFKNIKGDKFANTLTGTNQADRMRGLGGKDQLFGLGGKDETCWKIKISLHGNFRLLVSLMNVYAASK